MTPGAKVFDDDVGGLDERQQRLTVLVVLEVECHRTLATIEHVEVDALAVAERAEVPRVFTVFGFDLDDVRTGVGKQCGAVGSGKDAREVDDPDAVEWGKCSHVRAFQNSVERGDGALPAMVSNWICEVPSKMRRMRQSRYRRSISDSRMKPAPPWICTV